MNQKQVNNPANTILYTGKVGCRVQLKEQSPFTKCRGLVECINSMGQWSNPINF